MAPRRELYRGGSTTAPLKVGSDGLSKVIIRGSGFTGASVTVGGQAVSGLNVRSDTELEFVAPAGAHGSTADIVITNNDGSITKSNWLVYYDRPVKLTDPSVAGTADRGETLTFTPGTFQTGTWNSSSYRLIGCLDPISTVQEIVKTSGCDKTYTATTTNPYTLSLTDTHFCRYVAFRHEINNAGVYNYVTSETSEMVLPQSAPYANCFFANGALGSAPATGTSTSPTAPGRSSLYKTNEAFLGWNTQADGSGTFYPEGATLPSNQNNLLYAMFGPRVIHQVAEINPGTAHGLIYDMAEINGKLYLNAKNDDTGRELFVFDGSSVELVADLNPGTGSGLYDTRFLAKTSTEIFFQGSDGTTGWELFKFDGTTISLVADFDSGPGDSRPSNGIIFNNKLYFQVGTEGYVYDLTTQQAPVAFSSYFTSVPEAGFRSPATYYTQKLFFYAGSGPSQAIFYTDGTSDPVAVAGTTGVALNLMGTIGAQVLFGGTQNLTGDYNLDRNDIELFRFDALNPQNSATLVLDINQNVVSGAPKGSYPGTFNYINSSGGKLFFPASSGFSNVTENRELYVWDGANVSLAHEFWPGTSATDSGWPSGMYTSGTEMFLSAQSSGYGREVWLYSGGTFTMLEDSMTGTASGSLGDPAFYRWGEVTYFSHQKGTSGYELYAYGAVAPGHQVATYTTNYTITYDANGGSGTTTSTQPSGLATLSSGTGFAMSGKVLLGWDTSSTATTATYAPSASYTLSGNVTLYAVWGDPASTPTINPLLPTLELPTGGGIPTAPSGGDLELTGKNLGGVKEAEVDTKKATIKEQGPTNLTLGLPELDPGIYDLSLTGDQGKLTIQGAIRVISGFASVTPDAQALIAAWTKVNEDRTEVRMYAKDPVGVGKVQFKVNGREIAWVRAVDKTDPKLWSQAGSEYLLRRVQLAPGKNRFEIWLNGVRIIRSTYKG